MVHLCGEVMSNGVVVVVMEMTVTSQSCYFVHVMCDTYTVLDSDVYLCVDMCCQQNSQNNIRVLLFMGIWNSMESLSVKNKINGIWC